MTAFQQLIGQTAQIDLSSKAAAFLPEPLRRVTATITHVTATRATLEGSAEVETHQTCNRCGRVITHPVSRLLGFGPKCSEALGLDRPTLDALTTNDHARIEAIRQALRERTRFEATLPLSYLLRCRLPDGRTIDGPHAVVERRGVLLLDYQRGSASRADGSVARNAYPATPHHARCLTGGALLDEASQALTRGAGGERIVGTVGLAGEGEDAHLVLRTPYELREQVKSLPGARWDAEQRVWRAPSTRASLDSIRQAFGDTLLYDERLDSDERVADAPLEPDTHVWVADGRLWVDAPYRDNLPLREVPFSFYDKHLQATNLPALPGIAKRVAQRLPAERTEFDGAAQALLEHPEDLLPSILVELSDDQILIESEYSDKDTVRAILGAAWDKTRRRWTLPRTPDAADDLARAFPEPIVAPEAFWQLREQRDALKQHELVKQADTLPDLPHVKTSAWTHQRQAYHFARGLQFFIAWMGMGTGKTLVALALLADHAAKVSIVLAPKRVLSVWPKEFAKHGLDTYTVAPLNKGNTEANLRLLKRTLDTHPQRLVVVVNYESAWRKGLAEALLALNPAVVLLDEIHRVKNHAAKASRFAARLAQHPSVVFRAGLTGTLMPNGAIDIFAQARAVNPTLFGLHIGQFKERYTVQDRFGAIVDYKNLDDLHERLMRITYRAGKEVLDLPPVQHQIIPVELKKSTRDLAWQVLEKIQAEVRGKKLTAKLVITKLLRLQQITAGFAQLDDGTIEHVDPAKRQALADLLEDFAPTEPLAVFGVFHEELNLVKAVAEASGRRYAELSGRADQLATWQAGKADVLGVQIRSGGLGVDMTRSRFGIYLSTGYSLGDYQQSLDRIHRPGQTESVMYYHLVASDSIDETVYAALDRKQDAVEALLNAGRDAAQATA